MRILVMAPHADDEILGLGGTISKHVTKGSIRRQSSSNHVLHNVFLRPDGKYVVVIMNETDDGQHVFSKHSSVTFDTFLPPHSIQTLILS